jgi:catechol 2,3-dioxygenase-like lactoylglutathione lyase family enzyme
MCADLDRELSFYRRMLHGRIDLLAFERNRRSGEESRTLVEALPEILGDSPSTGIGHAAVTSFDVVPPDVPQPGRRHIDFLLGDDVLARLDTVDDDDLAAFDAALRNEESDVSAQRKIVHAANDTLGAELRRRYRAGLTSVDELLHG